MVVYEVFEQGKPFQVVIDGDVQQIVDTQSGGGREPGFYAAGPFRVDDNYHVADLVSLVSESGREAVSIDHVARFVGPPRPYQDDTPDENQQDNTGTDNPQTRQSLPVASYSLQSRPPTAIPSPTPVAESVLRVEVLLAYDDNANQEADFNEGINGMSVRVVDGTTNRILGSAITGEQGIVQLQIQTLRTVRVVVPTLRRVFTKFVLFTGCVCFGRQRTQFTNFSL